jgi:2-polyprenyl-3-methyl-5-hydroxy-6-metoxy-1,4-benzoquinol methylase
VDAAAWDEKYREKPLLWSAEPNRFVVADLADLAPGTALDLGCGEGRNAVWLADRGWEVTAVDYSSVAIERARERSAKAHVEVEWILADVRHWFPTKSFDLVTIVYMHLPEWARLVGRATAWVAPGGHLYLVGHDVSTAGVSGPSDPALLWDPESVTVAARGLEVVFAERRTRPAEAGEAVDTVMLARRK